ncbi:hypothetical protein C8R45DRAFT_801690, partial [Mycena sanguinolenta]
CTVHAVFPLKQEEIFYDLVDALYVERNVSEAYSHFKEDFINHNPFAPDGIASSMALVVPIFTNPAVSVQVLHQVFAAPYGWVHYRIDGWSPEPVAVLDLYLFNGSCVQEHWDLIQTRPDNATNPHALF